MNNLKINNSTNISYNQIKFDNSKLGVIFIHGYMSDMNGEKALFLEKCCKNNNIDFIRFDLEGHGSSSGNFLDCTFDTWLNDCIQILEKLTSKPQILIGSSMGAWLMLNVLKQKSERIIGLIGIAAAIDFTKDKEIKLTKKQKFALKKQGFIYKLYADDKEPLIFSNVFFESTKKYFVLDSAFISQQPIRLIHGNMDITVPYKLSIKLAEHIRCENVSTNIIKGGDHRLSRAQDLVSLEYTLFELISQINILQSEGKET